MDPATDEAIAHAPRPDDGVGAISAVPEFLNHATQVWLSRFTHGLSPAALVNAWFDWATHLAAAPGKRLELSEKAGEKARRYIRYAMTCASSLDAVEPCIEPLPQDDRFRGDAWQTRPSNLIQQAFLLQQQWWHNVVTGVPGVTAQHERELQFLTRQVLDMVAPSNFLWTNPDVLRKTWMGLMHRPPLEDAPGIYVFQK